MEQDSEQFADRDPADDDAIVVQISWVHVAVVLVIVVGIGGALAAGLWVGRNLNPSTSATAASRQAPQAAISNQPVVPVQPQPQVQPVSPQSAGGVTTSFGRTPSVGDDAPEFTLKNLEGEAVNLTDFKGQPVLINFWATWCGPCQYEMPVIEQMYQTYQDEGFVVLAVDVQESITAVRGFVKSMELTFPVLLDYKGEVADNDYLVRAYPTSYFVGRDGKITATHRGMMNEQIMQRYMDQVLATEPAAEN